ncbi:MAG: ATP-binding protein [bacterium]
MRVRLTLERKFIALASAIILLCSFVANIVVVNIYRDQIFTEAEKRAHLLTESTAIFFTNTLLYQELDLLEAGGLLENHIQDLIADSMTTVKGVTVYDKRGHILATSDYQEFFETIDVDTMYSWSSLRHVRFVRRNQNDSFDALYPLQSSSKRFGTLRIEFSQQTDIDKIAAFKQLVLLVSVGFAIIGVMLAFFVASALARPIKALAGEMGRVEDPAYEPTLAGNRSDEIGDLERGFIAMLSRLKAAADEKERQQAAFVRTEKLASVGTLVSGLAHEINNPLAGILNCLRRIATRPEDTTQTVKYAQLMDNALRRIEKIVKDLLDFSRKRELALQRININHSISAAGNLIDLKTQKLPINLSLQLCPDMPAILGDPQHLEQVFMNLFLNAVDAAVEEPTITVKSFHNASHAEVEIADNGHGIAPEILHKIFDPFFTTKPVGQGTGLGLSVAKAIIAEHNGQIIVTSDTDGTVFHLSFPLAGEGEPAAPDKMETTAVAE